MKYLVSVFEYIDYEAMGDTTHKSISGGVATHSLKEIESGLKFSSKQEILDHIAENYGSEPYIFDNRLVVAGGDEFTSYEFYISEVRDLEGLDLTILFEELDNG